MSKSITFDRPTKPASPESWVLAKPLVPGEPTKRITVDIAEPLHHRIKVACAMEGINMTDVIRELLEQRFPKAGK